MCARSWNRSFRSQTIYELVQVWKNRYCDSSNCFCSLGKSSALQSVFEGVFLSNLSCSRSVRILNGFVIYLSLWNNASIWFSMLMLSKCMRRSFFKSRESDNNFSGKTVIPNPASAALIKARELTLSHIGSAFKLDSASVWSNVSRMALPSVVPPLVILTFVSAFYKIFISNTIVAAVLKGMEAGVAALMVDIIADMCFAILKKRSLFLSAMIPLSFVANYVFGINVVFILLFCCILCMLRVFYNR